MRFWRIRALFAATVVLGLWPLSAQAKVPPGTGITASTTAAGHLTSTSIWTIAKSPDRASQTAATGATATVHWTITTTKSATGTIGAYLDGLICVTNTGTRATVGLAIQDTVMKASSTIVLNTVGVDVSAKPQLNPGEAHCYPYTITVPAAAIASGAVYKDSAHVTITNQSCCPGVPTGPSPSATVALPTTATPIDASINVTDTNGQSFSFSSGGSQGYDQTFDCPSDPGTHELDDTATIQSTGQTASGEATVECVVYPRSNALADSVTDALAGHTNDCVSFFLDTQEAQSPGTCVGIGGTDIVKCEEGEDHHQGLARTQQLSDANGRAIYFFLSHSGLSEDDDRGVLMQFRYDGTTENEHVTGDGVTASLAQLLPLSDERHLSDITFLPDVNHADSGYLFVTKEFGLGTDACENDCVGTCQSEACNSCDSHKITIYYWQPNSYFVPLGDIVTGLTKPSHVLVDRYDDGNYYLIVLDNTCKIAQPYRAYQADLFPSASQGSMNIAAFQPLNCFSFAGDMGSQAKLVRDSTSDPTHAWFVLTYSSNRDDGFGDDFVNVRAIHLDQIGSSVGTCGTGILDDPTDSVHVVLPAGETSFTNTGTHYVDPNGRLLISSSERWAHDRGDPFGYESRVDECQ